MWIQTAVERPPFFIAALLDVWEASVSATHDFLTADQIQSLKPLVRTALAEIHVLMYVAGADAVPRGFMGVDGHKIEMLFLSPEYRGQGLGRRLIGYAANILGATYVDVNEQNTSGRAFYEHMGFTVFDRSELDGQGNPFPLLHMRREADEDRHREYVIRHADPAHIPLLNDIELAAATIFPPGSIPEHILSDRLPMEVLNAAMSQDLLWVALDACGTPVGYALLQIVDGFALLAQLDVHPDHGRKGIGTALVYHAVRKVRELRLAGLYLTTFFHVRWNAPFYEKLGFHMLHAKDQPPFLQSILRTEYQRGLDDRVAMRLSVPVE